MKWVDGPFFDLLSQLGNLMGYFITQAWFIGRIIMLFNLGMMAIKYAIKGQGLGEEFTKLTIAFISFWILINAYPSVISGLNRIVYEWSYVSTYTGTVSRVIDKARDNYDFWQKKGDKADESYSDIIRVVQEKKGNGEIGQKYVLDIYDTQTGFLRPNAVVRVLMLTADNILNRAGQQLKLRGGNIGNGLLLIITALIVILCGILAALQYFIAALEFTLITSVGVFLLPFMLWNGSKFLTEKLIGAIVGFVIKLLFVSIAMLLTINGFLGMMVKPFTGTIDQVIYMIFASLFYMMICQNGPQLAVTLLTGSPQMSLMEGLAAAGTYAAAGVAGAKLAGGTMSVGAKGGTRLAGATSQAVGAAGAVKELGGNVKDMLGAAATSVGTSAGKGTQSMAHTLGRSLVSGGKGSGNGFRKGAGTNRFSQSTILNNPTQDGHSKTMKEYLKERNISGQEIGLNHMIRKEEKANKNKTKPKEEMLSFSMPELSEHTSRLTAPPKYLALPPPALPAPDDGKGGNT